MSYRVIIQRLAWDDLDEAYRWAAQHAPDTAARWLNRFHDALQGLASNPERCSMAPESRKLGMELRQFLFGRKPNVFRAVFTIDSPNVRIIRIRRGSRRFVTRRELENGP